MTDRLLGRRHADAKRILLAGACGGLVEVVWVSMYAAVTPLRGLNVAREITISVFGSAIGGDFAPAIGIIVHFLLSFVIAATFATLLWQSVRRRFGNEGVIASAVAILVAIWAMNFFVVLPIVDKHFTELMPLPVTFISKALFGLALGTVLGLARSPRPSVSGSRYVEALARP